MRDTALARILLDEAILTPAIRKPSSARASIGVKRDHRVLSRFGAHSSVLTWVALTLVDIHRTVATSSSARITTVGHPAARDAAGSWSFELLHEVIVTLAILIPSHTCTSIRMDGNG